MKQRADAKTRFTAWLLCTAMLLALLPVTAWAVEGEEYEEITVEGWALSKAAWDGWGTGYGTAATYSDGILSATVTKESDWNAAHRLRSPALTSAVEDVEAIDITISFEHSTDSSGDVCLQLDASTDGSNFTSGGWGKVNANPTLSSSAQTYRFVKQSDKPSSLKQLALYFYVGDSWDGEFTGTAKISEIKVYKIKTTTPGGDTGTLTVGSEEKTYTASDWSAGNGYTAPTLDENGALVLTAGTKTDWNEIYALTWEGDALTLGTGAIEFDLELSEELSSVDDSFFNISIGLGTKRWHAYGVYFQDNKGHVTLNAGSNEGEQDKLTMWFLSNAYAQGSTFKISNIELPAPDAPAGQEYTIILNANGGTLADETGSVTTGTDGKLASLPAAPTPPEGKKFTGWFTAQTGGEKITTGTMFTSDATIYAQYEEDTSGYTGTIKAGNTNYIFTQSQFSKTSWPAQNDPKLNSSGEIELTGSTLTTGDGGWGNFADNGLYRFEWPKSENSSLDLSEYDQASLTVTYPAAQNTDKAKLSVEVNTGKKSHTEVQTLNSQGGTITMDFALEDIANSSDQSETPLTIQVAANGGGENKGVTLFDSSATIKISGITFSKSAPPASKNTITAKTTIPNVDDQNVWFKAFDETAITKSEQTLSLKVEAGEGGAFHADSVTAQKADGTDITSAVGLSLDKEHDKVTLNTASVDYNIILVVNYAWVNDSTPENSNTIKSVFIGNGVRQEYENLEAMNPYTATYETGDKPVFKVATTLWGGFPLDKITASLADGTDITGKLTIEDGESGFKNVTVDTTGITGGIELLATYSSSWNSGGSGGGGGGGGTPVQQMPNGQNGVSSSVVAAGTVATAIRSETKGGVLTTEVTPEIMGALIKQVKESKEETDLVTFQAKGRRSTTATALVVQAADLAALSEKTKVGLKAESGVADVTLSHGTVQKLAELGGEVSIAARRGEKGVYTVSVSSGGTTLADVPGGVSLEIHTKCSFFTQAYLVGEDGQEELIRWTIANQKGDTMRMNLPGSATVRFEDNPVTFRDVAEQSWGMGPVAFAASRGIFSGYDDGSFHPNTPMNRAMLVQILYSFEGRPDTSLPQFNDVNSSDWYAQAVGWAAGKGITRGVGNGNFGVSSIVSRQDAVCFLYRWMGSPTADESVLEKYSDASSIGAYARQAMAWALENGVITGDTASTIAPTSQVTRYQAAKLITDLVQNQAAWPGNERED